MAEDLEVTPEDIRNIKIIKKINITQYHQAFTLIILLILKLILGTTAILLCVKKATRTLPKPTGEELQIDSQ